MPRADVPAGTAVYEYFSNTPTSLFDLDGSTLKPITVDSSGVATLTGTTVKLGDDAATLLNQTFHITALKGGMTIGIATLKVNTK